LVLFFKKELLPSSLFSAKHPYWFRFQRSGVMRFPACLIAAAFLLHLTDPAAAQVSVLTHHYDNLRTGWNAQESALNPQTVSGGGFGLLHTVAVDEQLSAQPLIVPGVNVQGQGVHDVAYLATENNTIYAVDAESGTVLLSRNLGSPVPTSKLADPTCDKTSGVVGIDSTPVIDAQSGLLYVITYTEENNAPVYRLHALNTTTLADSVASAIVSASGTLVNNKYYQFDAAVSRQRPALLLANNTVYAAFGSFCDHDQSTTRGWILGWQSVTLAPLASPMLENKLVRVPQRRYLTSIWMSGNGPAADPQGNIYVVTGNSDRSGTTYDPANNPAESVLRLSADLSTIEDYFTPGGRWGEPILDMHDRDFGAGGVLLLPPQSGDIPYLAVALGKVGIMYLLNQQQLGGYVPNGPNNDVASVKAGGCWCGESYFTGTDGAGRIVTSGSANEIIWRVRTSPSTALVKESEAAAVPTGSGEGFFTSVSSNGTQAGSAIVWAVARPNRTGALTLTLLAYNAADSTTVFSGAAGVWSSNAANANVVPVVANGHVYVGSYKALEIFGAAQKRK
jgi:hypothetical protein